MRRLLALLAALSLLLLACGDDDGGEVGAGDDTTTSTSEPPTSLGDEPDDADEPGEEVEPERPAFTEDVTVDPETGEVDIVTYQRFLAAHGAPEGGAEAAALEMLAGRSEVEPTVTSEAADGGRTVISVVYEGLADDSVAAERFELVFVADGDALILESGSWASRCQPGRGHEEFATGLCL